MYCVDLLQNNFPVPWVENIDHHPGLILKRHTSLTWQYLYCSKIRFILHLHWTNVNVQRVVFSHFYWHVCTYSHRSIKIIFFCFSKWRFLSPFLETLNKLLKMQNDTQCSTTCCNTAKNTLSIHICNLYIC